MNFFQRQNLRYDVPKISKKIIFVNKIRHKQPKKIGYNQEINGNREA